MHVFGLMAVFQGLKIEEENFFKLVDSYDTKDVEDFCRKFYEKNGHHIIPSEEETAQSEFYKILKGGASEIKKDRLELPRPEEEN